MDTKACIKCNVEYPLSDYAYQKKPNRANYSVSVVCLTCFKTQVKVNKKKYYEAHKAQFVAYNTNNEVVERRKARNKERRKTDLQFRINMSQRARIHEVLRGYKNCKSGVLLDCTREQLIKWLVFNFENGMTLDNFGEVWQIDHVVPVSFFQNTAAAEQRLCFHWSNLRPLRKEQNMSKSTHIDKDYILAHFATIQRFCVNDKRYQVDAEKCLWQRLELWYGNNPQDEIAFEEQLKRAIRSQVPTSAEAAASDQDMGKVQRLNASGPETVDHCQ